MQRRYEYSEKATIRNLLIGLTHARQEARLYVITRIVGILHGRGVLYVRLTKQEQLELLNCLQKARRGKLPLSDWLPRGYQIARFLMLCMYHLPHKQLRPSARDRKLIREAARHYANARTDRRNSRRQLASLKETVRSIGVTL